MEYIALVSFSVALLYFFYYYFTFSLFFVGDNCIKLNVEDKALQLLRA